MEANNLVWHTYFKSIRSVCPWSWVAYNQEAIDITHWHSQVIDLDKYQARVYVAPNHKPRQLQKIAARLNRTRPEDEFLWSHPSLGENSTHTGVLIQQHRETLGLLRNKLQLHK